jgi:hypothetical protein
VVGGTNRRKKCVAGGAAGGKRFLPIDNVSQVHMAKTSVSYMVSACSLGVWYRARSGKALPNECVVKQKACKMRE